MISVSGVGLVCVHDLNSLLVGPTEHIKFKTTKLIEGAKGGRCAVARTPDTGFTYLCAAVTHNLVLMQWYAPRKKFMKLKDFETPFDEPPLMMELLVLKDEALPVLCVGCTRDKAARTKSLAIINPNWVADKVVSISALTRLFAQAAGLAGLVSGAIVVHMVLLPHYAQSLHVSACVFQT